ncbi:MAG: c-type cytochrome [bacterium]|nr:c-type cytochrome [bacterium]
MLGTAVFWLAACSPGPKSSHGFRLPDGDPEAGKAAFTALGCVNCHAVEGAELDEPEERGIDIRLGGKVHRVRTYGELVTAVVHPSHDISEDYPSEVVSSDGESLMVNMNGSMTVQQLIDVVAFLQGAYREYLPNDYDPYFP